MIGRFVVDHDGRESAGRAAGVVQCETAHVVGGRIGQDERTIVAVELESMAAAEIGCAAQRQRPSRAGLERKA